MDCTKEFKCFQPTYVKKFVCDGRKCGAKCCRGWQVDIDRHTHEKYKSISDRAMRKRILDSLYWNEPSHTYRMNLDRTACPMLGDDLLCDIQRSFGENHLSNACSEFPRRTFVIDDLIERSLSMTCPIAAELALLDEAPFEFEEVNLRTTRAASFFYRSNHEVPSRKHLKRLQMISIDVLQDRRLTFNQRLMALGIMMSESDSILAGGRERQLDLIPTVYRSDGYFQSLVTHVKATKFELPRYFVTMFGLLGELEKCGAIAYYSAEQREFVTYPLRAFRTDETITSWERMAELYERSIGAYKSYVLERWGHVVEKYFVHGFFAGLYPCHAPMTLLNNYFLYLTLYKLFEFGLISMATVEGAGLRLEDVLEFIERFSNRADHASMFQQTTLDFIADKVGSPNELLSGLIDVAI